MASRFNVTRTHADLNIAEPATAARVGIRTAHVPEPCPAACVAVEDWARSAREHSVGARVPVCGQTVDDVARAIHDNPWMRHNQYLCTAAAEVTELTLVGGQDLLVRVDDAEVEPRTSRGSEARGGDDGEGN